MIPHAPRGGSGHRTIAACGLRGRIATEATLVPKVSLHCSQRNQEPAPIQAHRSTRSGVASPAVPA